MVNYPNAVIFEIVQQFDGSTWWYLDWRAERQALPNGAIPVAAIINGVYSLLWEGEHFSADEISAYASGEPVERVTEANETPATSVAEPALLGTDALIGVRRNLFDLTITQAAYVAGVSTQAVRDVLRDDDRRRVIFPGAYRTSDHPQRGEWRLIEEEVEAWKPRRKLDVTNDTEAFYGSQRDYDF